MKLLSYLISPVFGIVFFVLLLIFHPLQWIALKISYQAHKVVVDWLNFWLVQSLLIIGNKIYFSSKSNLPANTSLIFIANHQSLFDIPPLIWYLRKHHPKFVSKIELGKGIPSVSFNLKHGGAALINRKDAKQAISELESFGKRIQKNNWSSFIFPEGTRSRNGVPKKFSVNGLKTIIKFNPNSYIVPISINNSWKVFKYGNFPLGMFNKIDILAHQPISLINRDVNEVLLEAEKIIKDHVYES